jgi:hypothetical protein
MSKFPKIKQWLNEAKNNKVTVLYPGGFKPMTGGHLDLITRYSRNPDVKEVRVIVGPKTRNGIDQDLAVKIAKELTSHLDNVKIETSKYPSPLLTAYKEIETLNPGVYALGASSKGDDYKRVIDFTAEHQPGGKYHKTVPEGVRIEEMAVNADPALFLDGPHKGQPISASILRADIMEGDYEGFASGYPLNNEKQIRKVWDMLQGKVVNESYTYGYINESVVPKVNKHMTHAEDLVILGGKEGMDWVLKMLWDLYQDLKGDTSKKDMKLSVKIDGAPAIFAYSKFPGLPDNGIAMKGLFAKSPKVFTDEKEIDENFSDRPSLAYKLKAFLKHLPDINIPPGEIWQGDFLFDDQSIQETEIDGEPHYAFHPNTIYYVVPKDSELGRLIDKAEVGIAWHTRYTGPDLQSVQANYNAEASELTMVDELMMTDPYIKSFAGIVNFTKEESDNVEDTLEELVQISQNLEGSSFYKELLESKDIISLFTIFQNSLIKNNKKISEMDPDRFIGEFIEFLQNRGASEADKLKSEAGKQKKLEKFAEYINFIEENKDEFYMIVHLITEITRLKEMFVKKLNKIGQFQTYLKMKEGGLRGTNQEGFAVSDIEGNVVKLVDRGEFSWSNFSPEVQKGWEH